MEQLFLHKKKLICPNDAKFDVDKGKLRSDRESKTLYAQNFHFQKHPQIETRHLF